MKRVLIYPGIILSVFIGLLSLAVVVANLIPGNYYKSLIISKVGTATDRELTIVGDLDIKLSTTFAFKVSGIKLSNAQWGSPLPMISVDNIEGELALFPLLRGILDLTLVVDKSDLLFETRSSGQGNWQFERLKKDPAEITMVAEEMAGTAQDIKNYGGLPLRPFIRKLHVNETRITFLDGKSGRRISVLNEKLTVESMKDELAVELRGKFNDTPVTFIGGFDSADFIVTNRPTSAEFNGQFGKAKLKAKGIIGPLAPFFDLNVTVAVNTDSVTAFSPLAGRNLPDIGPLSFSVKLTGKEGKFAAGDLFIILNDKNLTAKVKGSIANLAALNGLDLEAKVDTEHLTDILRKIGYLYEYRLPDSVNAMVMLEGSLNNLVIKQFQAKIQGQGLNAIANGEAKNIIALEGVRADASLEMVSLDIISKIAKTRLPQIAPLKATASIVSKAENHGGMQIKANLDGELLHANVAGSIGDPLKLKDINAVVNLALDSLAWLTEYLKVELPPLDSLKASTVIASKGDILEVKDIKVDLVGENIQARIAASVKDVLKLAGINADINFSVDSLASLSPMMKQELPASGPVTLEGRISGENGLKAPVSIAAVVKSDGVMANITGSISEPLAIKGIELVLAAEAESIRQAGKLAGIEYEGQTPVKMDGRFTTGDNTYELADLHLQVGELDVTGHAAFKRPHEPEGRPRLTGKLHIDELDLSEQHLPANKTTEPKNISKSKEAKNNVKKDNIFPSDPLPLEALRSVDANIEVTIKRFMISELKFEDLVARLELDNGLLNIKPIKAIVGNGHFDGTITLDTGNSPPTLMVDAELVDGTFRDFGGKIHFLADLNGRGDSIAGIMAGLNGQLEFNIRETTLKKSYMTEFGKGLFSSIDPLGSKEKTTELICAIILFDIKDGIADADRKIAAQTTDVTWFGSGKINLKTEKIEFGVNPIPRKRLLHMGDYAKLVYLGGTLAQPKLQIDPKGMAKKYGKYLVAVGTGGLTWAADTLWGSMKANMDVCAEILKQLNTKDQSN